MNCTCLTLFTKLADMIVYEWFGMEPYTKSAAALHFFIEDTTKIFFLLAIMIYVIGLARASLNIEKVKTFLAQKHPFFGYFAAAFFGAFTPFCSCSSIPLFLGFTQAGIPLGITMSFLITSPMINEVAIVLLGGMLGMKFTIAYCAIGILSGVIGGMFFDAIKADRYLTNMVSESLETEQVDKWKGTNRKISWKDRHQFAKKELKKIYSKIWKWVLFGVGLGAALHGYVPQELIADNLGSGQWWSVPAAVLIGIPLYSNATGIIPVMETLLQKGLPIGTALALMMSTVAASMPEFVILKQIMKLKLLVIFFCLLLVLFTITGWIFNAFSGYFM